MIRTALAALPRFALLILAIIPVLTGVVVLQSMQVGEPNALSDAAAIARRASYPWAVIGHILGGSAMLILGWSQFSSRLRRALPGLHRWLGRGLVAAGTYFALSGLVMNASAKAQEDSALYDAAQNVMAVVFLTVLFLGIRAIRQRRVADHRAWMMRSYAITLGAATQTVLLLPVFLALGEVKGLLTDLVFIGAWVVNLAVAEWVIRAPQRLRTAITP
jgi:hypothetical protein